MQRPATTGKWSAALAYLAALALIALGALMLSGACDDYVPVADARRAALAGWLSAHGVVAAVFVWTQRALPRIDLPIVILVAVSMMGSAVMASVAFADFFVAGLAVFFWEAQTMWLAALAALGGVFVVLQRVVPLVDVPLRIKEKDVIALYALASPRYRLRAVLQQFGMSVVFLAMTTALFAFHLIAIVFACTLGFTLFLAPEEPTMATVGGALQAIGNLPRAWLFLLLLLFVAGVAVAAYDAYKSWREPEPR